MPLVALLRAAIFGVLFALLTQTVADPDLWGHVLGGRDIAAAGGVLRTDPYSFTSDIPWVNHQWLAELFMFGAWTTGGTAGLVALKLALILAQVALVVGAARRAGVGALPSDLMVALWVMGAYATTKTIRPQLFSVLLFGTVLTLLELAGRGRRWALAAIPVVMLLWANVHGGWVMGLGALGLWVLAELLAGGGRGGIAQLVGPFALVAACLATLCTPYGTTLWRFTVETVVPGHPDISEWRPLLDASPGRFVVWGVTAVVASLALLRSRRQAKLFAWLLVPALATASLRVTRLGIFFTTAVVMVLAGELEGVLSVRRGSKGPGTPPSLAIRSVLAVVAACLLTGAAVVAARNVGCIRMTYDGGPDPAAVAFIRSNGLRGRMVTWFDWGEYATWYLAPQVLVSMDARRETVYSDATLSAHRNLYAAGPSWGEYLAHLRPDYVWLPRELPPARALGPPAWVPLFESAQSVVFGHPTAHVLTQPPRGERPACFPGDPG